MILLKSILVCFKNLLKIQSKQEYFSYLIYVLRCFQKLNNALKVKKSEIKIYNCFFKV